MWAASLIGGLCAAMAFAGPESEPAPSRGIRYLQASILGVIEGLTEYIPVSSTGHLLVAQRAMGLNDETHRDGANAYAIAIQAGAILAVLGLYRRRIYAILTGMAGKGLPENRRLGLCLLIAFVPAALTALVARVWIKRVLYGLWPIVFAWIVGGAAILWLSGRSTRSWMRSTRLEDIATSQAWIIGLSQCLALWPGVSRSLATIVGALLAGLTLPAAVEFSFLLGLITLGAATLYEGYHSGGAILEVYGWGPTLLGLVLAFVFARLSMQWMVRYLQQHNLRVFGWYRIAIGVTVSILAWAGWI